MHSLSLSLSLSLLPLLVLLGLLILAWLISFSGKEIIRWAHLTERLDSQANWEKRQMDQTWLLEWFTWQGSRCPCICLLSWSSVQRKQPLHCHTSNTTMDKWQRARREREKRAEGSDKREREKKREEEEGLKWARSTLFLGTVLATRQWIRL